MSVISVSSINSSDTSAVTANIAHQLAERYGKKVLVIDMNTTASGVGDYFGIPQGTPGFYDIISHFKEEMRKEEHEVPIKETLELIPQLYQVYPVHETKKGQISLLKNMDYSEDSNTYRFSKKMDWKNFFQYWHGYGYFEYLIDKNKNYYDMILLNCGQSTTDIGLIGHHQLCEKAVVLTDGKETTKRESKQLASSGKISREENKNTEYRPLEEIVCLYGVPNQGDSRPNKHDELMIDYDPRLFKEDYIVSKELPDSRIAGQYALLTDRLIDKETIYLLQWPVEVEKDNRLI